jgi:hypothetical protein
MAQPLQQQTEAIEYVCDECGSKLPYTANEMVWLCFRYVFCTWKCRTRWRMKKLGSENIKQAGG